MRIRLFLALTSASFVTAGFGIQACGGTSEEPTPVATDSAAETAADSSKRDVSEIDSSVTCEKKDFLGEIPDASIADGASTTGICVACSKSNCSVEADKCASDCVCQDVAGKALECYAKTRDVVGCFASLAGVPRATQNIGLSLLGCIQRYCGAECATSSFTDAGDAAAD